MLNLYQSLYEYYYLIFILQGICIFHSIRSGSQSKWIFIIMFLPVIGSLIYLFTEVLNKRSVSTIQTDVVKLVTPGAKVKDLEKRFHFSNTFANRVALADAYLEKGLNEKAIELYEPALKGLFENNEHVIEKLIQAYFNVGRFEDITRIAPRIAKKLNFNKSQANLLLALSWQKMGKLDEAEKEFEAMNKRFSNYQARYCYGMLLLEKNEEEKAEKIFSEIIDESKHMSRRDKGEARIWIDKAKQEWNKTVA